MALFNIKIDKNSLKQQIRWVDQMDAAFRDPRNMDAGVKHIGRGMLTNFKAEGSHAGHRWVALSQTTQRVRRRRGFDPNHPILEQTGGLKAVSAESLANWHIGQGSLVRTDGKGTGIAAATVGLHFQAKIQGKKVENHWGGMIKNPRAKASTRFAEVRLPRRRFFGITGDAAEKAFEAINDKMMMTWARKSRNTTRIG